MSNLPPYLFARIDEMKAEQVKKGVDIIDLGVGDPDLPTPPHIVAALCTAARDPDNHHYPSYAGMPAYREAVAGWYHKRFGVTLDASKETLTLMGSKDGITHIGEAFVNPGDYVLAPSPGYPGTRPAPCLLKVKSTRCRFYRRIISFRSSTIYQKTSSALQSSCSSITPIIPQSAVAPLSFYREVVDFAADNNIVVVSDNPYSEVAFNGYRAPSFLEAKGAMEVGVEMHSLSKTYNMTGWRIGMAVGNAEILAGLGRVKTNIDSGVFNAVQHAAIAALSGPQDCVKEACAIYQERRDVLVSGLCELGFDVPLPKATFYVWMPVKDCMSFAAKLLNTAGIVVTPGIGFGSAGEGYVRFAITRPVERIKEAIERMRRLDL